MHRFHSSVECIYTRSIERIKTRSDSNQGIDTRTVSRAARVMIEHPSLSVIRMTTGVGIGEMTKGIEKNSPGVGKCPAWALRIEEERTWKTSSCVGRAD